MEFTEYCSRISLNNFEQYSVILLKHSDYSPLFCERFINLVHRTICYTVKKIELDSDFAEIQRQLHTSFLGQTFLYWFSDISSMSSKKKRADWLDFLQAYQGPHVIIGMISEPINLSRGIQISIDDTYSYDQVQKLSMLYDMQKPETYALFLSKIYKFKKKYSLEELCILLGYVHLLSKKNLDLFFNEWIEKLVRNDVSLYQLSQYMFEKKALQFFNLWNRIRFDYSEQFWTVFFSEQFHKAYFFVKWVGNVPADQKQITFGLPFSFFKQDWKLYSLKELFEAHQEIYEIDLALKQGGSVIRLDAFFIKFFA